MSTYYIRGTIPKDTKFLIMSDNLVLGPDLVFTNTENAQIFGYSKNLDFVEFTSPEGKIIPGIDSVATNAPLANSFVGFDLLNIFYSQNLNILNSGTTYNLISPVNGSMLKFKTLNGFVTNVRFVPLRTFQKNGDICFVNKIDNKLDSLRMERSWLSNTKNTDNIRMFTTLDFCNKSIFFNYCTLNEKCGKNCFGACSNNNDCVQKNNGEFKCGTRSATSNGSTSLRIIILTTIIVLFVFMILYVSKKINL